MTRNPPNRRAGFTLTEIMIALAMTALLLVGISKIFALTSATISTGQAAAKAMRSQRAIQQTLSNDFLGSGPDIGSATYDGGMLPLVNSVDANYAAPFLTISCNRIAAYKNAADKASDAVAPVEQTGALSNTDYRARSLAIRGIDSNNDGSENAGSIFTAGGETIPLYIYGDRNFRCDLLGLFSRGRFVSQTGSGSSFQSGLTSNEAFVWYGHLKIYNSEPTQLDRTNGYAGPGDYLTPTGSGTVTTVLPNRNNLFADTFRLGRMQLLMAPAVIPNGLSYPDSVTTAENDAAILDTGVLVGGDPNQAVRFLRRNWLSPEYIGTTIRPSMTPFDIDSPVYQWTNGVSRVVYSDDRLAGTTPAPSAQATDMSAANARTDVLGVDLARARKRVSFVEDRDLTVPLTTNNQTFFWESISATWPQRFWANPFPRTAVGVDTTDVIANQAINSKSLAQRQQILADNCSQFIVEFAGDFVTQDATGVPIAATPDGILDFTVVNNVNQTRWYGLPRDVDGDGVIAGYLNAQRLTSPDVIPVTDFASTATNNYRVSTSRSKTTARNVGETDDQFSARLGPSSAFSFERTLPPLGTTPGNYATLMAEPTGTTVAFRDPRGTSYTCVWGVREFEHGTTLTAADGSTRTVYAVPQLIRVLVDIRDPDGRMKEPLTQEYVFPVRVTGSVKPPANPG